MNKFLVALTGLIGALALGLAFTGAGASAQSGDARLRVLHASPDAPNVDVYLDGTEAVSDLAFNAITGYVTVPAGAHAVQVFPAAANGAGTPVIDVPSLTLAAGTDYTVAAVGEVASIEPLVLTDNNAAPAAGKAHIRVVHLSPDAPNVDIYAAGAGVVVPDLAFKAAGNYLPLDAASYDLEVRAAGASTAVLSLPGTALEAGKVYTAFAVGLAAGQPALSVKLTTDAITQQPTASAAGLPSSGGTPPSSGSDLPVWIIVAGVALVIAGVVVPATLARRAVRKD